MLLLTARLAEALVGTTNRAGYTVVEDPSHRRALDDDAPPNPYQCSDGVVSHLEDWKVFGTNLGGWLVLEPWITPSLFYQFLNIDHIWGEQVPDHTGMDSYTFCEALGPEEANRQMRKHWDAWVREEDVAALAASGANVIRIPVGDWMYIPYGPYIGCMDGAMEQLDRVLALFKKYKLTALLDVHAMKGSQNGFDNSGQAQKVRWTQTTSQNVVGYSTFEHWPLRSADWVGPFDLETASYPTTDTANLNRSVEVIRRMVAKHKDNPAVWGLEPLNEPWQFIPLEPLKQYYWDAYWLVREGAPKWRYVIHDSFRGYPAAWWDFLKGCPMKAMDTHIYQAWNMPAKIDTFYTNACNFRGGVQMMETQVDMPTIVGEWSLATDNCAMWLNGFNDNLPGYPKVSCAMAPCAAPYMGEQPGAPPDDDMPLPGPYGTGVSGPQFGQCPIGVAWGAPTNRADRGTNEDEYMHSLAHKHINSFNSGHGWFFWNFRTELEDRWSFIEAWKKGWFPANVSDTADPAVVGSCAPDTVTQTLAWSAPAAPRAVPVFGLQGGGAGVAMQTLSPQQQQQQQQQQPPPSTSNDAFSAVVVVAAAAVAALAVIAVAAKRHLGDDRAGRGSPAGLQAVEGLLQRVRGEGGAGAASTGAAAAADEYPLASHAYVSFQEAAR